MALSSALVGVLVFGAFLGAAVLGGLPFDAGFDLFSLDSYSCLGGTCNLMLIVRIEDTRWFTSLLS